MKIKSEAIIGDIVIIELLGEIESANGVNDIQDCIYKYLEEGKSKFIFDFEDVPHLNSSGLGVIISPKATIDKHSGQLILCNLNEKIKNLLTITKLATILDTAASLEEAREKLK